MKEKHPNWFFDFKPMKILILGSFPPHTSKWSFPFYYPNKQNRFWKILSSIAKIELNNDFSNPSLLIQNRQAIMKKLHVGIDDVADEIIRDNKSSLDTRIEIIKYTDILSILSNHSELKTIILLGFSAKNSAANSFLKYVEINNIKAEFSKEFCLKVEHHFFIIIGDKKIKCVILNSTSSASAIKIEVLIKQFKKYL